MNSNSPRFGSPGGGGVGGGRTLAFPSSGGVATVSSQAYRLVEKDTIISTLQSEVARLKKKLNAVCDQSEASLEDARASQDEVRRVFREKEEALLNEIKALEAENDHFRELAEVNAAEVEAQRTAKQKAILAMKAAEKEQLERSSNYSEERKDGGAGGGDFFEAQSAASSHPGQLIMRSTHSYEIELSENKRVANKQAALIESLQKMVQDLATQLVDTKASLDASRKETLASLQVLNDLTSAHAVVTLNDENLSSSSSSSSPSSTSSATSSAAAAANDMEMIRSIQSCLSFLPVAASESSSSSSFTRGGIAEGVSDKTREAYVRALKLAQAEEVQSMWCEMALNSSTTLTDMMTALSNQVIDTKALLQTRSYDFDRAQRTLEQLIEEERKLSEELREELQQTHERMRVVDEHKDGLIEEQGKEISLREMQAKTLTERLEAACEETEKKEAELLASRERIGNLEGTLSKLQHSLQESEHAYKEMRKSNHEHELELQAQTTALEKLSKKHASLEASLAAEKAKASHLAHEGEAQAKLLKTATKELADLQLQSEKAISRLNEEMKMNVEMWDIDKNALEKKQREVSLLTDEAMQIRKEHAAALSREDSLAKQLESLSNHVENKAKELYETQSALAAANVAKTDLEKQARSEKLRVEEEENKLLMALERLEIELHEVKEENEGLILHIEELKVAETDLNQHMNEYRGELATSVDVIASERKQALQRESKISQLQTIANSLQQQLATEREITVNKQLQLEHEIDKLQLGKVTQQNDAASQVASITAKIVELEFKEAELNKLLEWSKGETKDMHDDMVAQRERFESQLKATTQEAEEAMLKASKQITTLEVGLEELNKQLTAKQAELKVQEKEQQKLLADHAKALRELHDSTSKLEKTNSTLTNSLAQANVDRATMRSQIETLEKDVEQLELTNETRRRELKEAKEALLHAAAVKEELASTQFSLEETAQQIQDLETSVRETREEAKRKLADVRAEAAAEEEKLHQLVDEARDKTSTLKSLLANNEELLEQREKELGDARSEVAIVQVRLATVEERRLASDDRCVALGEMLVSAEERAAVAINELEEGRASIENRIATELASAKDKYEAELAAKVEHFEALLAEETQAFLVKKDSFEATLAQEKLAYEKTLAEVKQSLADSQSEVLQVQEDLQRLGNWQNEEHNRTKEELNSLVKAKELQCQQLKEQALTLQDDFARAKAALAKQSADHEEERKVALEAHEKVLAAKSRAEGKAQEHSNTIAAHVEAAARNEEEKKRLVERAFEERKSLQALNEEHKNVQGRLRAAESQVKNLEAQCKAMQEQLEETRKELRARVSDVVAQQDAHEKEKLKLVDAAVVARKQSQAGSEAQQKLIDDITKRVEEWHTHCLALEKHVEAVEAERDDYKAQADEQLAAMEADVSAVNEKSQALRDKMVQMKNAHIAALQEQERKHSLEINAVSEKLNAASDQRAAALTKEIKGREDKLKPLEKKIVSLQEQLQRREDELVNFRDETKNMVAEQLRNAEAKHGEKLIKVTTKLREEAERASNDVLSRLLGAEQTLQMRENQLEEIRQALASSEEERRGLEEEKQRALALADESCRQYQEAANDNDTLAYISEDLALKIPALETRLFEAEQLSQQREEERVRLVEQAAVSDKELNELLTKHEKLAAEWEVLVIEKQASAAKTADELASAVQAIEENKAQEMASCLAQVASCKEALELQQQMHEKKNRSLAEAHESEKQDLTEAVEAVRRQMQSAIMPFEEQLRVQEIQLKELQSQLMDRNSRIAEQEANAKALQEELDHVHEECDAKVKETLLQTTIAREEAAREAMKFELEKTKLTARVKTARHDHKAAIKSHEEYVLEHTRTLESQTAQHHDELVHLQETTKKDFDEQMQVLEQALAEQKQGNFDLKAEHKKVIHDLKKLHSEQMAKMKQEHALQLSAQLNEALDQEQAQVSAQMELEQVQKAAFDSKILALQEQIASLTDVLKIKEEILAKHDDTLSEQQAMLNKEKEEALEHITSVLTEEAIGTASSLSSRITELEEELKLTKAILQEKESHLNARAGEVRSLTDHLMSSRANLEDEMARLAQKAAEEQQRALQKAALEAQSALEQALNEQAQTHKKALERAKLQVPKAHSVAMSKLEKATVGEGFSQEMVASASRVKAAEAHAASLQSTLQSTQEELAAARSHIIQLQTAPPPPPPSREFAAAEEQVAAPTKTTTSSSSSSVSPVVVDAVKEERHEKIQRIPPSSHSPLQQLSSSVSVDYSTAAAVEAAAANELNLLLAQLGEAEGRVRDAEAATKAQSDTAAAATLLLEQVRLELTAERQKRVAFSTPSSSPELIALTAELDKRQAVIKAFESECTKMGNEVASAKRELQNALKEQEGHSASLSKAQKQYRKELTRIEEKAEKDKKAALEAAESDKRSALEALGRELDEARKSNKSRQDSLEKQLEGARDAVKALQKDLSSREEVHLGEKSRLVESAVEAKREQQSFRQQSEVTIADLQQELTRVNTEHAKLVASADKQREIGTNAIVGMQKNIEAYKSRIKDLETTSAALAQESKQFKEVLAAKEAEVSVLLERAAASERLNRIAIADQTRAMEEHERRCNESLARREQSVGDSARAQVRVVEEQLETAARENVRLEKLMQDQEKKHNKATAQLQITHTKALQHCNEVLTEEAVKTALELKKQIQLLESQAVSLDKALLVEKVEVKKVKEELKSAKAELARKTKMAEQQCEALERHMETTRLELIRVKQLFDRQSANFDEERTRLASSYDQDAVRNAETIATLQKRLDEQIVLSGEQLVQKQMEISEALSSHSRERADAYAMVSELEGQKEALLSELAILKKSNSSSSSSSSDARLSDLEIQLASARSDVRIKQEELRSLTVRYEVEKNTMQKAHANATEKSASKISALERIVESQAEQLSSIRGEINGKQIALEVAQVSVAALTPSKASKQAASSRDAVSAGGGGGETLKDAQVKLLEEELTSSKNELSFVLSRLDTIVKAKKEAAAQALEVREQAERDISSLRSQLKDAREALQIATESSTAAAAALAEATAPPSAVPTPESLQVLANYESTDKAELIKELVLAKKNAKTSTLTSQRASAAAGAELRVLRSELKDMTKRLAQSIDAHEELQQSHTEFENEYARSCRALLAIAEESRTAQQARVDELQRQLDSSKAMLQKAKTKLLAERAKHRHELEEAHLRLLTLDEEEGGASSGDELGGGEGGGDRDDASDTFSIISESHSVDL